MKRKCKLIAVLAAAAISLTSLPDVYALTLPAASVEETSSGNPEENNTPSTPVSDPYLGSSGAFSGDYKCSLSSMYKGNLFDIAVNTYLPIENYTPSVTADLFNSCNITVLPLSNENFRFTSATPAVYSMTLTGSFLCVSTTFSRVECLGEGNQLNYMICYMSNGQSVSAPISVSIAEYKESTSQEPVVNAVFALGDTSVHKIAAGKSTTVSVNLTRMNNGGFSSIVASLSSPDNSILVEETGTKTSTSTTPLFQFRVSVPLDTPAGNYSLTLHTTVYDYKGSAVSQEAYTIPVLVTSDVTANGLTVSSYQIDQKSIRPGDRFALSFTLENNCNMDLKDIKVYLSDLDPNKFVLNKGFTSKTISLAASQSKTVTFNLIACSGITSVRESITIGAEYRLSQADSASVQKLSTSIIVKCVPDDEKQETGKYDITMTNYSLSGSPVTSGSKFTLNFSLKNVSDHDIRGARVTIPELNGSKFALDSGLTYADFDLKSQASRTFSFPLVGCDGIASIREVLPVEISFGQQSQTVYVTLPCQPKENAQDSDNVFAPAIIIENYSFGGEYVTGGNIFPLTLTVKNAGTSAAIENLKITISGGAGNGNNGVAFSPANSSNSFFIEALGPKATTQISLDLLPRADATPDSYPVIVNFEYEYIVNGKRDKAAPITETITIPLQQEDRLTINRPDYPETVGLGEMAYISVSLINKGKSDVYNVTADIEGEGFDKSSGAYYIGNITSGSEEYYDVQITPYMEGDVSAELVITYEDSNGAQREQRSPINISVISYNWGGNDFPMDDPIDDPFMEEENSRSKWFWFAIGGSIAALVVIILVIVIVKKRKKKRELEIEDEDI